MTSAVVQTAYWPIVVFAMVTAVSPGPANFLIMHTAAREGVRGTVPVILGLCVGFQSALAVGLGAANAGTAVGDWSYEALKLAGVAYLLYLAWCIGKAGPISEQDSTSAASFGRVRGFAAGILLNWVNPKGWVMVAGAASLGTSLGGDPLIRSFTLCGLFLGAGLVSIAVWLLLGLGLASPMRSPKIARSTNVIMAGSLVVAAIALAFGH